MESMELVGIKNVQGKFQTPSELGERAFGTWRHLDFWDPLQFFGDTSQASQPAHQANPSRSISEPQGSRMLINSGYQNGFLHTLSTVTSVFFMVWISNSWILGNSRLNLP